ncbi:MAG TPA: PEGA domain-containing protein [Kofleriaceae bacterium]
MSYPRAISLAVLASLAIWGGTISVVRADVPSPAAVTDAAKHFQRGVTMYSEADYRAALVEFRRAYEIAPNPAVLYNIGETYYQLQNYAAALVALGRYLTESGQGAAHRREVEQTIDTLQTRVGKVAVTTTQPGCDITVDDELIGKTPLDEPVLVSIGRRKITAMRDGRVAETRFVDVAAGDTVKVALSTGGDAVVRAPAPPQSEPPKAPAGTNWVTVGWYTTGIAGGIAVVAGGVAIFESHSLSNARNSFPTTHDTLTGKADLVKGVSYVADIAGLVALVSGGLTLKYSLSQSSSHEAHVAIAPNGIQIAGKF